jgi:hypothetical protein
MTKVTLDNVDVYTIEEAAIKLNRGSATIWRMIRNKIFTPIKWANRTYVPASEIEKFLNVRETIQQSVTAK